MILMIKGMLQNMIGVKQIWKMALLVISLGLLPTTHAQEELQVTYVDVYPIIVTNYLRPKGRKPGFVQIEVEIAAYGPTALETIEKHLPLIRDTIIEHISFTEEAKIKDISQRSNIRSELKDKINKVLEKHVGYAYADDLVITRFMWE